MAKLSMSVSHRLSRDEALSRIRRLLGEVKEQFADRISDLRENWRGDVGEFSFSAMGFSVSGVLTVEPHEVKLNGNLPFAASFFKGKIESAIRERAERMLA